MEKEITIERIGQFINDINKTHAGAAAIKAKISSNNGIGGVASGYTIEVEITPKYPPEYAQPLDDTKE